MGLAWLRCSRLGGVKYVGASAAEGWPRRINHSAIYIMIGGTYSPFIAHIADGWFRLIFFTVIWTIAIGGIALKLMMPGRFERLSIVLYLALGWSGLAAYDAFGQVLHDRTWVVAGNWRRDLLNRSRLPLAEAIPFHNAISHGFVLVAAICHYFAVLSLFTLYARPPSSCSRGTPLQDDRFECILRISS
jgi:hemolysin III